MVSYHHQWGHGHTDRKPVSVSVSLSGDSPSPHCRIHRTTHAPHRARYQWGHGHTEPFPIAFRFLPCFIADTAYNLYRRCRRGHPPSLLFWIRQRNPGCRSYVRARTCPIFCYPGHHLPANCSQFHALCWGIPITPDSQSPF